MDRKEKARTRRKRNAIHKAQVLYGPKPHAHKPKIRETKITTKNYEEFL